MITKSLLPILLLVLMVGCNVNNTTIEPINDEVNKQDETNIIVEEPTKEDVGAEQSVDEANLSVDFKENNMSTSTIKIEVNNKELIVELEDNAATKELVSKLNSGNVVVKASEYGGFEKVGALGFSLTKDDKQISTKAGDLVLYQGNQISLFYNSNSWSYTMLGKVTNVSADELKEILGNGDVTLTLKK